MNIYEFKAGRQAVPQIIHADGMETFSIGEIAVVSFYVDVKTQRTPTEQEQRFIEARLAAPSGAFGLPAIDPDGSFTAVERNFVHTESVFPGFTIKRIVSAAPCECSGTTLALYPPACMSCGGTISATEAK